MQQTGRARSGSGILRLRGSHSSCYAVLGVHVSLRPHLSPDLDHGLKVVALRGQQAVHSSSIVAVTERQLVRTVMQSQSHLRSSCWISGGYQGLE